MDLASKWNQHLRRNSKKPSKDADIICAECRQSLPGLQVSEGHQTVNVVPVQFSRHFSDCHENVLPDKGDGSARDDFLQAKWHEALQASINREGTRKSDMTHPEGVAGKGGQTPEGPEVSVSPAVGRDDRKSPSPSVKRQQSQSRSTSPPKKVKTGRFENEGSDADFKRPMQRRGKLWDPDQDSPSQSRQPVDDNSIEMIRQPDTRAISQEQLVAEVKGIYAGLVMVESKCIEVVSTQTSACDGPNKLNKDQWHALIALHRTLLHEHHDFFLASQHPSASPALRRLAAKYAMPARMWRHGIHSFLELLRHCLPDSLEHMLTFIYMAYSMMALLLETVPTFEDTWIECLGDLGRYRMAIEDDDIRDREHWASVSRHWYSRASDKSPTTGRLYHHLGILARPNAVLQLFYYTKSLGVEIPFLSARESIMTLFDPVMSRKPNPQQGRLSPTDLNFVKVHGILFSGKQKEELDSARETFFRNLDNHIARSSRRWLEAAYQSGISNICALCGYGDETNPIAVSFVTFARSSLQSSGTATAGRDQSTSAPSTSGFPKTGMPSSEQRPEALRLFVDTYDIVCRRFGDSNILPFLHATLVFVYHLTFCPEGMAYLAPHFPWKLTATMLNTLLNGSVAAVSESSSVSQAGNLAKLVVTEEFPGSGRDTGNHGDAEKKDPVAAARRKRPLPDDFAMRGFPWVETYFPKDWFDIDERIDDDDKYFELPSMLEERKERVVWLGGRIAAREGGKWLRFDAATGRFGVAPEYDVDLDVDISGQMPATPADSTVYDELPDVSAQ